MEEGIPSPTPLCISLIGDEVSSEWVPIAHKVWETTKWAKVLHKTAQYTKVTLVEKEIAGLKVLFSFLPFLFTPLHPFS